MEIIKNLHSFPKRVFCHEFKPINFIESSKNHLEIVQFYRNDSGTVFSCNKDTPDDFLRIYSSDLCESIEVCEKIKNMDKSRENLVSCIQDIKIYSKFETDELDRIKIT